MAGIDIGTGSCKAVALAAGGTIIGSARQFYATQHPLPGYSEQDPDLVWQACCKTLQQLFSATGMPQSVVFSSAMHSMMAVDATGMPLAPLMLWSDNRSAAIAHQLQHGQAGYELYQATGTPLHAMSPLCKIAWLRQNNPRIFGAAKKFISIKEYVWYRLFGVYEVDDSIASATGLFDIHNFCWHEPALQFCGIHEGQLSAPVPAHHTRQQLMPAAKQMLGIGNDLSFMMGASDGCLANLGSFATEKNIAALTIGTSGAVRVCSPKAVADTGAMLFNYRLDRETFVCGGPVSNGGNILQWLLQRFLNIETPAPEDYDRLFDKIETLPGGTQGLIFLPYLHGERAPVWDAQSSGCFAGIRQEHGQEHFLRAALEGVCFGLRQVIEIIEKHHGAVQQLNVSGGFIHSKTWMQVLADITGKKLCLIQTEDASAVGAAMMGLQQFGISYRSMIREDLLYTHPDLQQHQRKQPYFDVYKTLYGTLRETMHRLRI